MTLGIIALLQVCAQSPEYSKKLILKRILEIQDPNRVDLTGPSQHDFKNGRRTSTLSLDLQSIISRALDNDEYVLVSSLDLSAVLDIVNIDLLVRRLKIAGLPSDVIALIREWLSDRFFCVEINGHS
jgi:hypothetical protein